MTIENVAEQQGKLGRLKKVGSVRKEFICRECQETFPIGSPCYNQSDYRQEGFFPEQTKVCMPCGKKLIDQGTEVKEKVKKPKKRKVKCCGVPTIYQKPNSEEFWYCGDVNPIIGVILCEDCKK